MLDMKGDQVPTVSFGNNPLVRCEQCRAYINPFARFSENGAKWKCNLCGSNENVPNFYQCGLNANGQRLDLETRMELSYGTFDIKAGSE
jgi:protein transport protein SEC24